MEILARVKKRKNKQNVLGLQKKKKMALFLEDSEDQVETNLTCYINVISKSKCMITKISGKFYQYH